MKNIIAIITILLPMLAFSSETCSTTQGKEEAESTLEIKTDVPSHLKGATIIIRTADGKESSVPAEKFKVVARKQQFIVTKTKQTLKTSCSTDPDKNRVSVMIGNGTKEGLDVSRTDNTETVESKVGAVVGAQYQRLVTKKISVSLIGQSNKTALVGVGLDF